MIYEGDKWSLIEEMTCDAPQGSRVGPLVWNVMYNDFLRMNLPAGTSIIGFADDALVMCAADDVKILELRINDSLWRAKRWLDIRCLKIALEKTEALLVTDRRSFSLMLQSKQIWMLIESFVTLVMKTRELDGRAKRGNNGGQ